MTDFPVRFHNNNLFRIAENGDVRVVRNKNQLAAFLNLLNTFHDNIVDELVVEIVFWLVDQERTFAVQEQNRQDCVAFLPGGKRFGCFICSVVVEFDLYGIRQGHDLKREQYFRFLEHGNNSFGLIRIDFSILAEIVNGFSRNIVHET